jgi:Fic family protein
MVLPLKQRLGSYVISSVSGEKVRAFIPPPLPPAPALKFDELHQRLDRANQALGRLNGMATLLPDVRFLIYLYTRKEALVSSQIEGTQSSFADLLLFENNEAPHVPVEDVEEVSNYVAAMQHGLRRLKGGFPLSLRLIREIHAILLRGGRGARKMPGEFRRTQNWIGGSRPGNASFVPPPPERLLECLDSFERFLHDETHQLPVLIEAGLAHVQFESIHPFLDGNGRLGRLLITLLLWAKGALAQPLFYPSLYLKSHRDQYYVLLQGVRTEGAWEDWLAFFLEGVAVAALEAADTAERTLQLFARDRERIQELGRAAPSALRLHGFLQSNPYVRIRTAAKALKITVPTVTNALKLLSGAGIVKEVSGKKRDRLFAYSRYVNIVGEGTNPLSTF